MAVSIIVSPFVKELEDGANVWTSAESLFAASSKLFFVLVLASKNKDVTKVPCNAGIFFVQPVGIPDDPEGDLLGFHITVPYAKDYKKIKMLQSARKALDFAQGID